MRNDEKTHREAYPEQYTHPLVGKTVTNGKITGKVLRVFATRFGQLAEIEGQPPNVAFAVALLKEVING